MEFLIDFVILGAMYLLLFFGKWKSRGGYFLFINTVFYVYLSFVLYFTLMPIAVSIPQLFNHPYKPMELIPFSDVLFGRGDFIRQIVLNVVMTVPFGFLFPLTGEKNAKFVKTIICCFLMSLVIELSQPLINGYRSSDITDLITNTVGGAVGYLLHLISKPLTDRMASSLRKKRT